MEEQLKHKKVVVLILDGFGLAPQGPGNAILAAKTPHLDALVSRWPSMALEASGLVVGLPWGSQGNSEVGHCAIGTGRVVVQDLAHINGQIRSGEFFRNSALLAAIQHAKKAQSALHLIGCTSPGGIHSHVDHLIALLELARRHDLKHVFVHFIADGQDMPAQDAHRVLETLHPHLQSSGARIASVIGRSYAMDRVLNWSLTERTWQAIADGLGTHITNPREYLEESYAKNKGDYDIVPATVVDEDRKPIGVLQDNDSVIFYDFRADRARQLAAPFVFTETFSDFQLVRRPKDVFVTTMTQYSPDYPCLVAYPPEILRNTLGEVLSNAGIQQWRIAEKEKEAHVSSFFNGGRQDPWPGESRLIIPSEFLQGAKYLEFPEMKAKDITRSLLDRLDDDARLYVVNFANADMIGHAGDYESTIKAIETIDTCIGEISEAVRNRDDMALLITADHGNAEELLDPETGEGDTQHSTRFVPIILQISETKKQFVQTDDHQNLERLASERPVGSLIDVAPTILVLMGIKQPEEMTGSSLL